MELETTEVQVIPEDKSKINKILKVALILGVVTAIEFVIAFTVPAGVFRTSVFIIPVSYTHLTLPTILRV